MPKLALLRPSERMRIVMLKTAISGGPSIRRPDDMDAVEADWSMLAYIDFCIGTEGGSCL